MSGAWHYLWFGLGLLAITALTLGLGRWARIGLGLFPLWAILRAAVQLTAVALLLRGILAVPWTVAAFVVLMLSTASWTAAGRLDELWHGRRTAVLGLLSGALVALVVIFGLRLVDFQVRYLVAVGGIVIGNSMTAATLAGRNFVRGSRARRGEVVGDPCRHLREQVGRRRADHDQIGLAAELDMAHLGLVLQIPQRGIDRAFRQGRKAHRGDEMGAARGQDGGHRMAGLARQADQLGGLVGGNATADDEEDAAHGCGCATPRARRTSVAMARGLKASPTSDKGATSSAQ